MIRLQMLDGETAVGSSLPELDMINLCGNDETIDDQTCIGMVSPTDTTLPTTKSGDELVDSRAKCRRSLVDVAEEDGVNDERKPSNHADEARQCVICNDEDGPSESGTSKRQTLAFCRLPCCEDEDLPKNFNVCVACMLVLTIATSDGASRVGHCPRCRSWIALMTLHSPNVGMSVRKLDAAGKCEGCLHTRETLIEQDQPTCDACFLGKASPLLYECEECHETQNIAHTLYRCQPRANRFGNE
jgi:hypothetical protein